MGKPRRTWSREEKRAIVAEMFAPGVRIKDVMLRHAVSSSLIYTWRKELRAELGFPEAAPAAAESVQRPAPLQFLPLAIAADVSPTTIDIAIGGAMVKITGAVDAAVMAALVTALRGKTK